MIADQPTVLLSQERHVVIRWSENQPIASPPDREALRHVAHVGVRIGDHRTLAFGGQRLARLPFGGGVAVTLDAFGATGASACR